jgi:hypothetical protein
MFSPVEPELERGWPGRLDGDRVVQLAAQTLQAFFTGGGMAREHAVYPLAEILFRAPVLHPPSVRLFAADGDFAFANPAAIAAPEAMVRVPAGADRILPVLRHAAIVGTGGEIGGYTLMAEWTAPSITGAKSRDFAISLGPIVITPDELTPAGADWAGLVAFAAENTRLLPGDVIAAPGEPRAPVRPGDVVELAVPPFGTIRSVVGE